jgi:hypothetical protein
MVWLTHFVIPDSVVVAPAHSFGFSWEAVVALSSVALVLTGLGAIAFAWKQLATQRDVARVDSLEKQVFYFESEHFLKFRKALAKSRIQGGRLSAIDVDDPPSEAYVLLNFFEHIGLLVRRKHLDVYDVWHSFAYWATPLYYDARRLIEYEQLEDLSYYDDFVWLISEMQRIQAERNGQPDIPSDEDLFYFYEDEAAELGASPRSVTKRRKPRPVAKPTEDAQSKIRLSS